MLPAFALTAFAAPARAKHPCTTRRRRPARPPCTMSSVQTPTSFPRHWYDATIPDLTVDLSAYHLSNPDADSPSPAPTDRHFVDAHTRTMGLLDLPPGSADADAISAHLAMALARNHALYTDEPRNDLRRSLSAALSSHAAPAAVSALVMDASSNLVRLAWTGACGLILIRDNCVVYRTYDRPAPRAALEELLTLPAAAPERERREKKQVRQTARSPAWGGYTAPPEMDPRLASFDEQSVRTEFLELEDNDLLIAGSDGFFANVSEEQILAFVRPVPDGPEDATLAIANHTCLASWTTDDVDFISYYLAFLAANFATAQNSAPNLPFPFPPSPHVDDITVLCASCSFA